MRQKLAEARGRLILRQFVAELPWALLIGFFAVVALRAAWFFKYPVPWWMGVVGLVAPLIFILLVAMWRWRTAEGVARALDAEAATKDRFLTMLGHREEGAMGQLLRGEAEIFIKKLEVRAHLPLRWRGRAFVWLLLPIVALGGLEYAREWRRAHPHPQLAEAQELLEKVKQAAAERKDLEKIAAELEEKKQELADSSDPLREALRTMAGLEERLSQNSGLTAAEAEALADALEAQNAALAKNLREGNRAEAARQLGEVDPKALADALKQAAKHLENKRLEELSQQQAQVMRAGVQSLTNPQGEGQGGSGSQFRAAMRDIKNGAGDQKQQGGSPQGQPNGAPDGSEKADPSTADNAPPGGAPGSEKDLGKGDELAGEAESVPTPMAADDSLSGEQGEGTSVVQMLRMPGADDPQARTQYRSAYQTAEAAALDAVNREEIPIGSRLLVRKYFEAIRPKE